MRRFILLICFTFSALLVYSKTIKVICIGASITYGAGIENRSENSYPARLQAMLGKNYEVYNYGVSGNTMLKKGNMPYWKSKEFKEALSVAPDIVLIDLGGNDSKLINRVHLNEFENDYTDFITAFKQLPSNPRIILLSAMPSFVKDTTGIWDRTIKEQVNPRIQNVAFKEKVEIIDMHAPFVNKETLMPDKIHPNKEGALIMAKTICLNLMQKRDTNFNVLTNLKPSIKISSFYGYECADFTYNNRSCKVVKPKLSAIGNPWVWRARFWGHEPQTDIALLQSGFHIVYCDVAELLGNTECVKIWDDYYSLLKSAGLSKKTVLEGMSRGGIYTMNWAAKNPNAVACAYLDNPLLNVSDWVLAIPKSDRAKNPMVLAFMKDYNLTNDSLLIHFKENPIDKIDHIARGKYPILILCADADEQVSPANNTFLFEQKLKAANGNISVIIKPGFKHHPHSFANPQPIVDFILKSTGYFIDI
jgi:lysophospholipase L1-like esterase/dienelactone hydrolase